MMTDQQQGARMLTLGERIVQAARLATELHLREHLHQSVDQALVPDGISNHATSPGTTSTGTTFPSTTSTEIGGADPVSVGIENDLLRGSLNPFLLAHRLRRAGKRLEAA